MTISKSGSGNIKLKALETDDAEFLIFWFRQF